ncbi:MAG: UDP-N-acetylmuramate dehydrogenase [Verrucomicrobia bacterium]|nr:UDP-N-acetylmuramate dehydrogenase [Verrucomicrobiota bacterium]
MTITGDIMEVPKSSSVNPAVELARILSAAAVVRRDEPLAKRTTLRVGGPADVYVEPANESDLAVTVEFCHARGLSFFVMGRGSNLLVRDGGFRGVVICLASQDFSRVEIEGERLRCGAGVKLKQVAVDAKRAGLAGVEFLEGIPGSVGGALRMNAGAMGGQMFDVIESVRVMDRAGQVRELTVAEIPVEYRCCPLLKDHIALGAVFRCRAATRAEVEQRMNTFSEKRWESQPSMPSAGCMFKNPATIPAGKLIEELGFKEKRVGGAMVSKEHGNFIVNTGNATAHDVLELAALIKARAWSERKIELQTEVEIVGVD